MLKIRNVMCTMVLTVAVTSVAGAQTAYQRPTTAILPIMVSSSFGQALQALCVNACAGTRWADRVFSEGILTHDLPADTILTVAAGAQQLTEKLQATGTARRFLLRQFLAESDFQWRNDSLRARSEYAVTTAEAQKMVREVNGPDPDLLKNLTAGYLFAISATDEKLERGKGLFGNEELTATARLKVSVVKLGYRDAPEAMNALTPYFCAPGCTDKATRQRRFNEYQAPVSYVASFTGSATGVVDAKEGEDAAWRAAAESALEHLIDESASKVAGFAIRERIVALGPPAARIGKKEGVKRGARYYVYRAEMSDSGTIIQKRGAVLLANKVADNRTTAFTRGAASATVTKVDSTTFKRVYPGGIDRGDQIVEHPSEVSLHGGLTQVDGTSGAFFEARLENLGLPVGVKVIIPSIKGFAFDNARYTLLTGTAGLGYELTPLRGRIRITPLALFGLGQAKDTQTDETADFWAMEYGADFGLRLHPAFELSFSYRRLTTAIVDDISGDVLTSTSPALHFGIRLQRGRFGL